MCEANCRQPSTSGKPPAWQTRTPLCWRATSGTSRGCGSWTRSGCGTRLCSPRNSWPAGAATSQQSLRSSRSALRSLCPHTFGAPTIKEQRSAKDEGIAAMYAHSAVHAGMEPFWSVRLPCCSIVWLWCAANTHRTLMACILTFHSLYFDKACADLSRHLRAGYGGQQHRRLLPHIGTYQVFAEPAMVAE